jgi:hypothetical protein
VNKLDLADSTSIGTTSQWKLQVDGIGSDSHSVLTGNKVKIDYNLPLKNEGDLTPFKKEQWRHHHDQKRPYGSLGNLSTVEFAEYYCQNSWKSLLIIVSKIGAGLMQGELPLQLV